MTEPVQQLPSRTGVTDRPLVLTTLLIYSIVIGVSLGNFPPTGMPTVADVLILAALILLTLRIVLTFYYAATSTSYPAGLFVLELFISVLFAGQFGVALAGKADPSKSLWLFYAFHLALIATMPLWNKLAKPASPQPTPHRPTPHSVVWMRILGVAFSFGGIGVEEFASRNSASALTALRWAPAVALLGIAIWYGITRPWPQIEQA